MYNHGVTNLIAFVVVILGIWGVFSFFMKGQHANGILAACFYVIPPTIIDLIRTVNKRVFENPDEANILFAGPLLGVWICWVIMGSMEIVAGDFNAKKFYKEHLSPEGKKGVVRGIVVLLSGLLISLITLSIPKGPIKIIFYLPALMLSGKGYLHLMYPVPQLVGDDSKKNKTPTIPSRIFRYFFGMD